MNDYSCLKSLEGHSASVLSVRFVNFQMPALQSQAQGAADDEGNMLVDSNSEAGCAGATSDEAMTSTRAAVYNSMQILSGSADGLLRLWDIRSGECVRTFDQHQDKVWSVAFPTDGGHARDADNGVSLTPALAELGAFFVSAGSDSRMLVWRDNSQQEEKDRLDEIEGRTLAEQSIDRDLRAGRHGKVRTLSHFFSSSSSSSSFFFFCICFFVCVCFVCLFVVFPCSAYCICPLLSVCVCLRPTLPLLPGCGHMAAGFLSDATAKSH